MILILGYSINIKNIVTVQPTAKAQRTQRKNFNTVEQHKVFRNFMPFYGISASLRFVDLYGSETTFYKKQSLFALCLPVHHTQTGVFAVNYYKISKMSASNLPYGFFGNQVVTLRCHPSFVT